MQTLEEKKIRAIAWPERQFIIKREKVPFDKLPAFFTKTYVSMYALLEKSGSKDDAFPCAIYYSIDEENKITDVAAAIPVSRPFPSEEFELLLLPDAKLITITHVGSYESMASSYTKLEEYLAKHGLKRALIIEEYLTDPDVEKDPNNYVTNIYFQVY